MKTTITKKEKAIEIMKKMDIYKPYIKGFKENDQVCFFEQFGGFWIDQEPELYAKMKAIENEHKCKVYAVTHEYTEFGELYDFLNVRYGLLKLDTKKRQTTFSVSAFKKV